MLKTFVRLAALRAFLVMSFSPLFALKYLTFSAKTGMTPQNTRRVHGFQPPPSGTQSAANRHAVGGQLSCNRLGVSGQLSVVSGQIIGHWSLVLRRDIPTKTSPTSVQNHPNHLLIHHLPSSAPRVADGWLMAGVVHLLAPHRQLSASAGHLVAPSRHPMGEWIATPHFDTLNYHDPSPQNSNQIIHHGFVSLVSFVANLRRRVVVVTKFPGVHRDNPRPTSRPLVASPR